MWLRKFSFFIDQERPLLVLVIATLAAVLIQQLEYAPRRAHSPTSHQTSLAFRPAVEVPSFFKEWRTRFCELYKPVDKLGLARGIFLGETSAIDAYTKELFLSAGLSHLLAASGYNCCIVALFFGLVGRFVIELIAAWLSSVWLLRLRRIVGPLSQLVGAWLFWLWTDQSPPITRSVVLISTKFIFELLEINVPFPRLLLVQYLCSLAVMPRLWWSASFQLTFGCLFGLVWVPHWVKRFKPKNLGFWKDGAWNYLFSGLGACFGALPTTLLVFHEINLMSLLTNLYCVPIVSFVVMPLGLLTMMAVPWIELSSLAHLNARVTHFLCSLVDLSVEYLPALHWSFF